MKAETCAVQENVGTLSVDTIAFVQKDTDLFKEEENVKVFPVYRHFFGWIIKCSNKAK